MSVVNTRTKLIDYCFRRLGAPVIQVNVDEDQVDDRVDDAIQRYQYFHQDASERQALVKTITAEDITNEYLTLNDNVQEVISIIMPGTGTANAYANIDVGSGYTLGDVLSRPTGNLSDYYMTQSHISLINSLFGNKQQHFDFNQHTHKLKIVKDWADFVAGDSTIVIECYTAINPEVEKGIYNDRWLKQYATALIKKQWGENLKKLRGVTLPGGVELNGQDIYNEAVEEINELEEKMLEEVSDPVDFFLM